jgi:putative ABC transport system permease protein
MNALVFAWRGLVRQPARAVLGIVGVAAASALLFDMLLLSRGLMLSMQDLLDRGGFSVRVTATEALPGTGPRIGQISETAAAIAALAAVDEAVPLRLAAAEIASDEGTEPLFVSFFAADSSHRRPWTIVDGRDVAGSGASTGEVLLNRQLADLLGRRPGQAVKVRASCGAAGASTLPPIVLNVAGIAEFPFDDPSQLSAATTLSDAMHACGDDRQDDADLILVAGAEGAGAESVRRAIQQSRPDLHAVTNDEVVARLQRAEFSYFRQISAVLVAVTLSFAFLLIAVLLTVSVNQRLGEIAALRALGFSQRRVVADVICESALIVGLGGALALPLGLALARWLDRILKAMPGVPSELHFFIFQPRAVAVHIGLLAATAILAALYPMRIVARLPIAATLRKEVVS